MPIAGSGLAAAAALRQFRRHGIDPAARRLALGLAGVISTVSFAVVAAAGAVLAGNPAGAATGLLSGCGSVAAVTVVVIMAQFGIGVVEVTLIAALAVAGLSSPAAVGAVLLYRIMTFKILGTLICALYPYLRRR